jgi:hypothetical protein
MQRKLKTALDETRMLMMGTQILFGFQREAVFHENFAAISLADAARNSDPAGAGLSAIAAPGGQHSQSRH